MSNVKHFKEFLAFYIVLDLTVMRIDDVCVRGEGLTCGTCAPIFWNVLFLSGFSEVCVYFFFYNIADTYNECGVCL